MRLKALGAATGVTGTFLLAGIVVATQQPSGSSPTLIGVWKVAEATQPDGRRITHGQGMAIYSRQHYSFMQVTADKPRADLPPRGKATEHQLIEAFGPFSADSGTYEVKGNEVTFRTIVNNVPNAMREGSFVAGTIKFENNNTVWFSATRSQNGPMPGPLIVKMTRLE